MLVGMLCFGLKTWALTCEGRAVQQMEGDPLLENLDDLLPINDSTVPMVPANLPSAVEDICKALMEEEQIDAVDIGRQVGSALLNETWAVL